MMPLDCEDSRRAAALKAGRAYVPPPADRIQFTGAQPVRWAIYGGNNYLVGRYGFAMLFDSLDQFYTGHPQARTLGL